VKFFQEFLTQTWAGIITAAATIGAFSLFVWHNYRKSNSNAKEILEIRKENAENFKALMEKITGIFTGELKTKDGEILEFKNGSQDERIEQIASRVEGAEAEIKKNSGEIETLRKDFRGLRQEFKEEFTKLQDSFQAQTIEFSERVEKYIAASKELAGNAIDVLDNNDKMNMQINDRFDRLEELIGGKNAKKNT
jgi:hypothetical protein